LDEGTGSLYEELLYRKIQAFGPELVVTIPLTPKRHLKDYLSVDGFLNCWVLSSGAPMGFQKACVSRANAPNMT